MSRKTSDPHDRLSESDGYRGGKNTDFNPPEPSFALDYDSAAAKVAEMQRQGNKRYAQLLADGGEPARGSLANRYGFNAGRDFSEYATQGVGAGYAAILRPEGPGTGITIWTPRMISADVFQTAARGGASGLTDDGPDGYLFYEDRRNPQYSVAMYENVGTIPAAKVYEAEKAGLVQKSLADRYRDQSPLFQMEEQVRKAKEEADRRAAMPKPPTTTAGPRKVPAVELSVYADGSDIWVAKTSAESMDADSPHPGVQVAGLDFMMYSGGQTYQALGLPKALLAYQQDGSIVPAVEEYTSIREEAANGSAKAQDVLAYLGLAPARQRGLFDGIFGG